MKYKASDLFMGIAEILCATNPGNEVETAANVAKVKDLLAARPPEQTRFVNGGTPDLTEVQAIAIAHARLGTLLEAAQFRGLPPVFVDTLRLAATEAARDFKAAAETRTSNEPTAVDDAREPVTANAWTEDPPVNVGPDIDLSDLT